MNLHLYAKGQGFEKALPVDLTFEMLSSINELYAYCLGEVLKDMQIKELKQYKPGLAINRLERGSLDCALDPSFLALYATVTPLLPNYVWDLLTKNSWNYLKNTFKFYEIINKYFRDNQKPASIQVVDSTDFVVNVVNVSGDFVVNVPERVKISTLKNGQHIENIAKTLLSGATDSVRLEKINDYGQLDDVISIDQENKESFLLQALDHKEPQYVELECHIYDINMKTLNGWLELYAEGEEGRPVRFTVAEGDIAVYAEHLLFGRSKVKARREYSINSFGENKLKHVHLYSIEKIH